MRICASTEGVITPSYTICNTYTFNKCSKPN